MYILKKIILVTVVFCFPFGFWRDFGTCTPASQTFTASGTFTMPRYCTKITVQAWGVGGGGGGSGNPTGGSAGPGGGGCSVNGGNAAVGSANRGGGGGGGACVCSGSCSVITPGSGQTPGNSAQAGATSTGGLQLSPGVSGQVIISYQ